MFHFEQIPLLVHASTGPFVPVAWIQLVTIMTSPIVWIAKIDDYQNKIRLWFASNAWLACGVMAKDWALSTLLTGLAPPRACIHPPIHDHASGTMCPLIANYYYHELDRVYRVISRRYGFYAGVGTLFFGFPTVACCSPSPNVLSTV